MKTTVFCLLLLATVTPSAAQDGSGGTSGRTQSNEVQAALVTIYNNLGPKNDAYNSNGSNGWGVRGPNGGGPHFFAMSFTPKGNSHVSQVQAAVQYGKGANQVNLSIYGDSAGSPGTLLAGPVTVPNLPAVGTCCSLAIANFSPLAITGGSRYWVVADTPLTGTGSDFVGLWEWVAKPLYPQADNNGSGWVGYDATNGEAAVKVLGTIP